ncbi:MAG: hypothetical protein Ct9H90mP7_0390 [Candidatus Neomarinimicrobiota bacterium]|nr:MAG: hypothetical protein Ct9H90mP7_0390 [Candidatus Neomarinimicrobiota bacterium]
MLRSIIEVEVNKKKKGKLRYIGRFNRKGKLYLCSTISFFNMKSPKIMNKEKPKKKRVGA